MAGEEGRVMERRGRVVELESQFEGVGREGDGVTERERLDLEVFGLFSFPLLEKGQVGGMEGARENVVDYMADLEEDWLAESQD